MTFGKAMRSPTGAKSPRGATESGLSPESVGLKMGMAAAPEVKTPAGAFSGRPAKRARERRDALYLQHFPRRGARP